MREMITLARNRRSKELVVIVGPDESLREHRKAVKQARVEKVHPEFDQVWLCKPVRKVDLGRCDPRQPKASHPNPEDQAPPEPPPRPQPVKASPPTPEDQEAPAPSKAAKAVGKAAKAAQSAAKRIFTPRAANK